jgi:hypothetical protein
MIRFFSVFILTIAMLLSAGCATSTPYQQAKDFRHEGYGYYDDKPEPQKDGTLRIRVGVNANVDTPDETIRAYWGRRAAELCGGPVSGNDAEMKRWLQTVVVSESGSPDSDRNCHNVECWAISSKVKQVEKHTESKNTYVGDYYIVGTTTQNRMEFTSDKNLEGYVYCPSK